MRREYLFTSESVGEGHPDKVADQISDAVLDACLQKDKASRVACETTVTTGLVLVSGEITTSATIDIPAIVRKTLSDIGYTIPGIGFDADSCSVLTSLDKQSSDISQGVTEGHGLHLEQGAGDQGMMFGYACKETPEFMPAPIQYSHALMRRLADVRRDGTVPFLLPDCKGQVTIRYEDGRPTAVDTVVVSTQHTAEADHKDVFDAVMETVVKPVIPAELMTRETTVLVNPTGRFVVGGPKGDCGLTGRKIIVDTYGGMGRHGGGAFSGKDPSKVDRSAAYYARYVAKNIVAAGLAERCEVQVAYAIGVAKPIAIYVYCFGTETYPEVAIEEAVHEVFDFRPASIVEELDLLRPIYANTSVFGHFGRSSKEDLQIFTWERTDRVSDLKSAVWNI